MKKTNRKILLMLITMIVSVALLVSVHAGIPTVKLYGDEDFEYTYEGMTEEKAQMILSVLTNGSNNGEPGITPASIFCIFGHDIKTGVIVQIYHRINPTPPRCEEVTTHVEYCSRNNCTYMKVLWQAIRGLYCHY